MTTLVLFEIRVKDADLEASYAAVQAVLGETKSFPGLRTIDVWVDTTDPASLTVVETWDSVEAHDEYAKWRSGDGKPQRLIEVLAGPPTTRVFEQGPAI